MPPIRARKIPSHVWESKKARLKHLFIELGKPILGEHGVKNIMKLQQDFEASKSQYESQFLKWGWTKYHSKQFWQELARAMEDRGRDWRTTDVFFKGKQIPPDTVHREISRNSPLPQLLPVGLALPIAVDSSSSAAGFLLYGGIPRTDRASLPQGTLLRHKPLKTERTLTCLRETSTFVFNLPFDEFAGLLRGHAAWSPSPNRRSPVPSGSPMSINPDLLVAFPTSLANQGILQASPAADKFHLLSSTVPAEFSQRDEDDRGQVESQRTLDARPFDSVRPWQILFSIANNFSGLDRSSIPAAINILQLDTGNAMRNLLRLPSGPTYKAIVQNLFKAAIENGNSYVVDSILHAKNSGIDINNHICFSDGEQYRPIELALKWKQCGVITVLLRHGADVERVISVKNKRERPSALERAIGYRPTGVQEGYYSTRELDLDILKVLLDAGCYIAYAHIHFLIDKKEDSAVVLLLQVLSRNSTVQWTRSSILQRAAQGLKYSTFQVLARMAITSGLHPDSTGLIELAIVQGDQDTVGYLLDLGGRLPEDSLMTAVKKGQEAMTRIILRHGARAGRLASMMRKCKPLNFTPEIPISGREPEDDFPESLSSHRTPLSIAIQLRNISIIRLFVANGALYTLKDQDHLLAALIEASEAGFADFVMTLTPWALRSATGDLGSLLISAIRNQQLEIVDLLLASDKCVEIVDHQHKSKTSPLLEALILRDESLAHRLLDVGADPLARLGDDVYWPLSASILHQCESITLRLLNLGVDPNNSSSPNLKSPLALAVREENASLVDLLLTLGANPKGNKNDPIQEAIERQSESLVRRLIDAGADLTPREDLDSPLAMAIKVESEVLFGQLVQVGASPVHPSVLRAATKCQNHTLVKTLLDKVSAPKLLQVTKEQLCQDGWPGGIMPASPFIIAVETLDTSLVQIFLDGGVDINGVYGNSSNNLTTALEAAAENLSIDMVQYLIERGADFDYDDFLDYLDRKAGDIQDTLLLSNPSVPLCSVSSGMDWVNEVIKDYGENQLPDALRILKEIEALFLDAYRLRKSEAFPEMMLRLFRDAIIYGNVRSVQALITKYLDFRSSDAVKTSDCVSAWFEAFGIAITYNRYEDLRIIRMFLDAGCHPNDIVSRDYENLSSATGFLKTIHKAKIAVVQLLLEYDADVNFPTTLYIRHTPLQAAVETGSLEIVRLLLDAGANINAPAAYRYGGTALQLAAIGNHIQLADLFLRLGAEVNAPGAKIGGRTALQGAAEHGRLEMLRILLNAGAGMRPSGPDEVEFGKAMDLATKNGHFPVREFLEIELLKANGLIEPRIEATLSSSSDELDSEFLGPKMVDNLIAGLGIEKTFSELQAWLQDEERKESAETTIMTSAEDDLDALFGWNETSGVIDISEDIDMTEVSGTFDFSEYVGLDGINGESDLLESLDMDNGAQLSYDNNFLSGMYEQGE